MSDFNNTFSVIGLGFVGSAMVVAINSLKKKNKYKVIGIEKNNLNGKKILSKLSQGKFPFKSNDKYLIKYAKNLVKRKVFLGTTKLENIFNSKVVICSINFDIKKKGRKLISNEKDFLKSISNIAKNLNPKSLLFIESTLPPGFCEKKIIPNIEKVFEQRGIGKQNVKLAYSFERVMPGDNYLNSIRNMFRVYSGNNIKAENMCKNFLNKLINTKKYPLTKLSNIRSVEMTKVIENSFRATNIAFIDEWTKFSEKINVDLNSVIRAIKVRSTHKNIMNPGLGVGGYCLTKDNLLGIYSSNSILKSSKLKFPFSNLTLEINKNMPNHTFKVIKKLTKNKIKGKKILIYGASYKNDVGDTRFSPSENLLINLKKYKCTITVCDPHVEYWPELKLKVLNKIKNINFYDLIIFAVNHREFKNINFNKMSKKNFIIDTCSALTPKQLLKLKKQNSIIYKIGKGKI